MKLGSIFLFVFMSLFSFSFFNNCDNYSDNTVFQSNDKMNLDVECIKDINGDCEGDESSADFLELRIHVSDLILLSLTEDRFTDGSVEFDIGGECYPAGFPSNIIEWRIIAPDGHIVLSSEDIKNRTVCRNGRFQIKIILEVGTENAQIDSEVINFLEVEIVGISAQGQRFTNSLLAKQKMDIKFLP